jgi:hypothetical protein
MKLQKPNQTGFSHHLVLVAFVLVFAVAGVAYLVASHAQTPPILGRCDAYPAPILYYSYDLPKAKVEVTNEGATPFTPHPNYTLINNITHQAVAQGQVMPTRELAAVTETPQGPIQDHSSAFADTHYTPAYTPNPPIGTLTLNVSNDQPRFSCSSTIYLRDPLSKHIPVKNILGAAPAGTTPAASASTPPPAVASSTGAKATTPGGSTSTATGNGAPSGDAQGAEAAPAQNSSATASAVKKQPAKIQKAKDDNNKKSFKCRLFLLNRLFKDCHQ